MQSVNTLKVTCQQDHILLHYKLNAQNFKKTIEPTPTGTERESFVRYQSYLGQLKFYLMRSSLQALLKTLQCSVSSVQHIAAAQ